MQKIIYVVLIIVLVVLVLGAWRQFGGKEATAVTNFEECIAAGNPAMESYPRQCRHGDETFVEEVDLFVD